MKSLQLLLKKCFQFIFLLPLFLLLAVSNAPAADITIAWDANTEPDIAGYKFFYGTSSRSYLNGIDVGNNTEYTLTGLTEGTTYYFAAKAYDTSNNESDYSQELVYTPPTANSAPNTPTKPTGPTSGFVQTSYAFNTSGTDPDGDLLTYRFDWGDGSISAWGGAFSRTHAFSSVGTYCIKAQSQDSHGAASDWSACLDVSIDIEQHTITASAGTNGSIYPAGPVTVSNGADQSFSISPNQSYRVADVVVDGSSVGAVTTYTFNSVDRDHTIAASFVAENQPPVSNAGADQAVRVSDTVQLDGSSSSDPNGDSLTYSWSFISRPGGSNTTLSNANAVKPTFVVDVAGSYTVRLIVNDGTVNSAPDTVVISTQNSAPVSNAGADQTVFVTDTVQLDGSASTDVDGDSLTFTWSFVSRPAGSNATLSNSQVLKPTFGVDVAGSYTVRLIVNDGTVNSAPDTVTISTANSAPVANAGADQAVLVSDTVQLDGSGSRDADGDTLAFKWTFVSRPGGSLAALSDTNVMKPSFAVDVAGTYVVQLIVNDGTADSAADTVTISTANSAPVANAGADQTVLVNATVQLDGSGSSDVDGDSLSFTWSFVSRPAGSSATLSNTQVLKPTFGVDVAGSYTVRLIVNDGKADSAADTVTISTENSAPVANAGADQAVLVSDTVQLDGRGSSDVDGDTLTFKWSFVSRPGGSRATLSSSTAVNPTFDFDVAGTYVVQLIVNDGTTDSAADTVTISTENSAPVANAGADQAVLVSDTMQLDGSGSSDVDGDSLTFKWSFVSRPSGSLATLSDTKAIKPTFEVDAAGTYAVQLIVNDGTTDSSPDTVTISTENSAPVANAGADQAVLVSDTVQLDGSGSSDVDGDSLTFQWSLVSRPAGSQAALSDTNAMKPTLNIDAAGSYTAQLIVNDGTVNSAPDTVTISTDNSAPVANAGADQAVLVSGTVQLDGSGSSDVDGDTLTFKWSFVSRPGGSSATLSSTTAVNPTFAVDAAGTYAVQLIVNDGAMDSSPDTVTISTENSAPVANAGADQSVPVTDTVQLDGSGSSDADGDTLTFKWSFVSRPGGSNATLSSTTAITPTFAVDAAGSYVVQLIVNDGTADSAADTVTISTENSAPLANAGSNQIAEEGITVLLSGSGSTDPDQNIVGYTWEQTGGTAVTLSTPDKSETSFVAPQVLTDGEKLTFTLTVRDDGGLSDVDTCVVQIAKPVAVDSDGDGVPDDQDAFPLDPYETMDSDGDGLGNNTDEDDDNDGMPDAWEISYGLNPLADDAADDPDGDGISNINEYNLGSQPNYFEGNFKPDAPELLAPENNETVGLTPLLRTDEFSDPNANDVHKKTNWKVIRAFDNMCVLDVTSSVSLTAMTVPRQVLEANTEYTWKARFIDSHDTPSEWSAEREFTTADAREDLNENGVPDDQEVGEYQDLDLDGTADIVQQDIRCVNVAEKNGSAQICISIRNAENAYSIVSLEAEDPADSQQLLNSRGKPNFIEFGLLDFKVMVDQPGDETTVRIYLSKPAYIKGNCFKYDPVEAIWMNYSDYAEFSPNRKEVYLTIKDGGFGDADGLANGIIVDPLAFGSETDPNGASSGAPLDELLNGVIPENLSCFISAAAGSQAMDQPAFLWRQVPKLGLAAIFLMPILLVLLNPAVVKKLYRRVRAVSAKYRC